MPFESPNYTQTPNDLFDRYLPALSEAELKLVLALIRHTIGFHQHNVKMSLPELARRTGLSQSSVARAAAGLKDKKLVKRQTHKTLPTIWIVLTSPTIGKVTSPTIGEDFTYHRLSTSPMVGEHRKKGKQSLNKRGESPPIANATNPTPLIAELERAFDIDLDGDAPMIERALTKHGALPGQVEKFAMWWEQKDWRGKKGEPPTASQIAQLWPQAFKSHKKITKLVGVRND